jgi:DNA adenine methylase
LTSAPRRKASQLFFDGIVINNSNNTRPPLKWAGGKRWLVPHLREIWKYYSERRLVEPFCGGLAVTLGLYPQKALLNDINPHAINLYQQLKRGWRRSLRMKNSEDQYYKNREKFNKLIREQKYNSKDAAELFFYLNRTGYNGLCRFNRSGEFNVPFGRYSAINYELINFEGYVQTFAKWDFIVGDFEDVPLEKDDFVYADPPYDVEFTQYAKEGFSWSDQERLVRWLVKHKGPVIISNQATTQILNLYESNGFIIRTIDAPRMINCTGDRTRATEVLAFKGIDVAALTK